MRFLFSRSDICSCVVALIIILLISFQVFKTDSIHVWLFCIYFDLTPLRSFLHSEKNEECIVSAIQFYGFLLILFLLLFWSANMRRDGELLHCFARFHLSVHCLPLTALTHHKNILSLSSKKVKWKSSIVDELVSRIGSLMNVILQTGHGWKQIIIHDAFGINSVVFESI